MRMRMRMRCGPRARMVRPLVLVLVLLLMLMLNITRIMTMQGGRRVVLCCALPCLRCACFPGCGGRTTTTQAGGQAGRQAGQGRQCMCARNNLM